MSTLITDADYEHNVNRLMRYKDQLHSEAGAEHLKYLMEERKLSLETIKQFHLGAVLDPDPTDLRAAGYICIPHLNDRGPNVLRFRKMPDQEGPKYLQPPGSKVNIFNIIEFLQPRDWIAVAEGEMDTMTLVQCGVPAVGFPGANTWSEHHKYLFDGFQHVVVIGDGDEAGIGFAEKVAGRVPSPRVLPLPDGADINSIYAEQGRPGIMRLLGLDNSEERE